MKGQDKQAHNKASFYKRVIYVLKVVLLSISIITFSLVLIITFFITPIVKRKIIQSVYNTSKGLYMLEFDDFNLKLASGTIHMNNVRIYQDTILLRSLREKNPRANYSDIEVRAKKIAVSDVKWITYLLDKSLKVNAIEIQAPDFIFKGNVPIDTIEVAHQSFLDVVPGLVASFAGSLRIRQLKIMEGTFALDLKGKTGVTKQNADSIFLEMKNIRIDTSSVRRNVLFTKEVKFNIGNYKLVRSDSLFEITIRKLLGSYQDSLLGLQHLQIKPLKREEKKEIYNASIKAIKAFGIDFSLFFKEKKISIDKMLFQSPMIDFTTTITESDSASKDLGLVLTTFLPYVSNSFKVHTLVLEDGNIKSKIYTPKGLIEQKSEKILLLAKRIYVSSESVKQSNYWGEISFEVKNYETKVFPSNIAWKVADLRAYTGSGKVYLRKFSLSRIHKNAESYLFFENNIAKVEGSSVNFHRLISGNGVELDHLDVSGMNLRIFNNEDVKSTSIGKMPNELLKELGFYLNIKKFTLSEANISLEKFNHEKGNGILTFNESYLTIENLSNQFNKKEDTLTSVLNFKSRIMNEGMLLAQVKYPLSIETFNCSVSGSLSPMDGTSFNSILKFSDFSLRSGQIELLNVSFDVDDGSAKGNLLLKYHDLKLEVTNKTGKKRKLKSFIANRIVKDGAKRNEPVNYKRQDSDGFISFVWNAVSEGIEKAVVKNFFEPFIKRE